MIPNNSGSPSDVPAEERFEPCPFCGSSRNLEGYKYARICVDCGSTGPEKEKRKDSSEAWNTRPQITALKAVLEELKKGSYSNSSPNVITVNVEYHNNLTASLTAANRKIEELEGRIHTVAHSTLEEENKRLRGALEETHNKIIEHKFSAATLIIEQALSSPMTNRVTLSGGESYKEESYRLRDALGYIRNYWYLKAVIDGKDYVHLESVHAVISKAESALSASPLTKSYEEEGHAGDCTIYASLVNGNPEDGICTCGYGHKMVRKSDYSQMYSKEREALHSKGGKSYEEEKRAMESIVSLCTSITGWAEMEDAVKALDKLREKGEG